ncbi:radical SAM protein [Candidatus Omnitrophota bacterium]
MPPEKRSKPFPHFLVASSKKIHGWYPWQYRECSSERFLLNPYNGCGVGCFYCYTRSFPGYFQEFHQRGSVYVFKDFDRVIARQLDRLDVGFCGYLSPVSDPFQRIDRHYHLSSKLIEAFVSRNLPIEIITKERIPEHAIRLLQKQEHSFAQVSILTLDKRLHRLLSAGPGPETLLENIKRLTEHNVYAVCRIDPVLPFITDKKEDLARIVEAAAASGARHIITSVLDIPPRIKNDLFARIRKLFGQESMDKYMQLYKERIGYLHADIAYRREIFSFLRRRADAAGLTFSLCMEYEKKGQAVTGLNAEFMTSLSCEGMDTPIYKRKGERFYPQEGCRGSCLSCISPLCGIEELAYGKTKRHLGLQYSDYRRY